MKVVISGAAGFIGHHLANALAADGHCVIGVDEGPTSDWDRLHDSVSRVHSPIEDLPLDDLVDVLVGSDVLFHLAAKKHNTPGVTAERMLMTNVCATRVVLEAATKARVGRFVFSSSLYAYGSLGPAAMHEDDPIAPITLYGATKAMGEHLCRVADRDFGLSWNVARLFFIYGPGQLTSGGYRSVIVSNFDRIASGLPPAINGDGEQALDYVYIDDCVRALAALAFSPVDRKVVNVASGVARTISDVVADMCDVAKVPFEPVTLPADWTHGSRRMGDASQLRELFGWKPEMEFKEGLQRVWAERRNSAGDFS